MFQSASLRLRFPPSEIVYLKFLLEGYDHLGFPIVLDGKEALIEILTSPEGLEVILALLEEEFPQAKIQGTNNTGILALSSTT